VLTRVPSMKKGMLIRRPPSEVFQAFIDPAVTTRFWFTKSSGKLVAGTTVQWDWEMYGVSTKVSVKEVEENRRIVANWGREDAPTTFEIRFIPWQESFTYVQITESGYTGSADDIVAKAIDSMGGFSLVLSALKALLEHNIVLTVVLDKAPKGLTQV